MNLNAIAFAVFWLIAAYLVLNNANNFNSIVNAGGGFITQNIALLQGRPISSSAAGRIGNLSSFA